MLTEFELRLTDDLADDWYGLYEFDWRLNSLGFNPDTTARLSLLERLFEAGAVEVHLSNWAHIHEAAPLSRPEALSMITDLSNWRPPDPNCERFPILMITSKV